MGGIGTPTTRATHIEMLFKRQYIAENTSKQIVSTELGRAFYDTFPPLARTPEMTALWYKQQSQIENGTLEYKELIHDVDDVVAGEIARIKEAGMHMTAKKKGQEYPTCEHGVLQKKGKHGNFWGFSRYPECTSSFSDKSGKPDLDGKPKVQTSDQYHYQKCTQGLIRRPARKKGVFWWGCSGYPTCDYRTFDNGGISKETASPFQPECTPTSIRGE